jgi:hypothetical protein
MDFLIRTGGFRGLGIVHIKRECKQPEWQISGFRKFPCKQLLPFAVPYIRFRCTVNSQNIIGPMFFGKKAVRSHWYILLKLTPFFRPVFPNLFDVAVPLITLFISHGTPWGKHLFLKKKLIYVLIISYVRDKVVYCCWVSIYALINDVILFTYLYIYLLFLRLAVPQGTTEPPLGILL